MYPREQIFLIPSPRHCGSLPMDPWLLLCPAPLRTEQPRAGGGGLQHWSLATNLVLPQAGPHPEALPPRTLTFCSVWRRTIRWHRTEQWDPGSLPTLPLALSLFCPIRETVLMGDPREWSEVYPRGIHPCTRKAEGCPQLPGRLNTHLASLWGRAGEGVSLLF